MKRVVVTGVGVIGPSMLEKNAFWDAVKNGNSAIKPWRPKGAPDDYPVKYAACVETEKLPQLEKHPVLEKRGLFGFLAAIQAYDDAGLNSEEHTSFGCVACSGIPDVQEDEYISLFQGGIYPDCFQGYEPESYSGLVVTNDSMLGEICNTLKLTGPVSNINGACAGATQAIGIGYKTIQRGEADYMLVGGADSVINSKTSSGLYLLGATATNTSRGDKLCCPFDADRSGLVAGEGGAFLVLEKESSAIKRGARIYAEIDGYGVSLDAYKVTAPHPQGLGAIKCMQMAIADSSVSVDDIEYINAHGTSTKLNDAIETKAIEQVFQARKSGFPLVSSTKSVIGHWISAAGAPEAIAAIFSIYYGAIPPTINFKKRDSECGLDYVTESLVKKRIKVALSNSFGFGGINASVIFKEYRHEAK